MEEDHKEADQLAETKPLQKIPTPNQASDDETQEMRALSVHEVEQPLKGKRPPA